MHIRDWYSVDEIDSHDASSVLWLTSMACISAAPSIRVFQVESTPFNLFLLGVDQAKS